MKKRIDDVKPSSGAGGVFPAQSVEKTAAFDRERPYNSLPNLPPPNLELETKPVLKQTTAASRALAELKGAGNLIPDQAVLVIC